jgi:hypothetical protein
MPFGSVIQRDRSFGLERQPLQRLQIHCAQAQLPGFIVTKNEDCRIVRHDFAEAAPDRLQQFLQVEMRSDSASDREQGLVLSKGCAFGTFRGAFHDRPF